MKIIYDHGEVIIFHKNKMILLYLLNVSFFVMLFFKRGITTGFVEKHECELVDKKTVTRSRLYYIGPFTFDISEDFPLDIVKTNG